jgi:hypothetical protein
MPCPQWCTNPVGHDHETISRLHHRLIADLKFTEPGHHYTRALVGLTQMEALDVDVWGPGFDGRDPVFIDCQLAGEEVLTGPDARRLAAALVAAADAWDKVTGV